MSANFLCSPGHTKEDGMMTYILADSLVGEVLQQLQLSQCPQGKHGVIEWCNLLDCDFGTRLSVGGRDDHTVCPFSNHINDLVGGT